MLFLVLLAEMVTIRADPWAPGNVEVGLRYILVLDNQDAHFSNKQDGYLGEAAFYSINQLHRVRICHGHLFGGDAYNGA